MIRGLRKKIDPYPLILLLLGGLCLTWFRGDFIVNPGDFNFSIDPINDLYRSLFVWDHQQGFGQVDSMATSKVFPYNLLLAGLAWAGLSLSACQKILFFFLFAGSGLSSYMLIKWLLRSYRYARPSSFFGANFYMMNMYLVQFKWGGGYMQGMFFYAAFPLMILNWLKARDTCDPRYLIYMVLSTLIALPSMTNPTYLGPVAVVVTLDLLLQVMASRGRPAGLMRIAKLVAIFCLIFVGVFAFWFVSIGITFGDSLSALTRSTALYRQDVISSSASSILNMFRQLGHWGFFASYGGDPYYRFAEVYSGALLEVVSLLIVGFSFLILVMVPASRREPKNVTLFLLVYVAGLWLSKGLHSPGGSAYGWALGNVPLFLGFRAAYEKFGPLLCISSAGLIGFSAAYLLGKVSRQWIRIGVLALVPLALNVYAWPFWTGDLWQDQSRTLSGFRFKIPAYYENLQHYLDARRFEGRLLQLPPNTVYLPGIVPLRLDGIRVNGPDPLWRLLRVPVIYLSSIGYGIPDRLVGALLNKYQKNPRLFLKDISAFAGLLNIDSILLRKDVDNGTYPWIEKPQRAEQVLKGLRHEATIGEFDLYALPNRLPLAYAATGSVLLDGNPERILDGPVDNPKAGSVIISTAQNRSNPETNRALWTLEKLFAAARSDPEGPGISIRRINPTLYNVHVENYSAPFALVFSEQFDRRWMASRTSGPSRGGSFLGIFRKSDRTFKDHFIANSYANGWIITAKNEKSLDIAIEFAPQRYFEMGAAISLLSILACLLYLVWRRKGPSTLR